MTVFEQLVANDMIHEYESNAINTDDSTDDMLDLLEDDDEEE